MKFLVLGSNSFAGSTFIDHLLGRDYEVVGISRSSQPHSIFIPYTHSSRGAKFQFYQMDINNDLDDLISLIREMKPEYVVDFAGQGMVAESWGSPEDWYQTNILSKVKLHNVLKDCVFLKAYARVSTPEVYGSSDGLIDESAPYNPSTPYAVSHMATDVSLKAFFRQYRFPVLFPRFANFYGPCQQLYRIVPRTIICALSKKTLFLHGGGKAVRAFIHSKDVAEGLYKTITKGQAGEVYHFSTSEHISIRDLVWKICLQLDVDPNEFVRISEDRPGKDQAYLMSYQKAQRELDWEPTINLERGITETIGWVRENFEVIMAQPQEYRHQP